MCYYRVTVKEWLMSVNAADRPSFFALLALGLLLVVVPFYHGGARYEAQLFLFFLSGPFAYFAWRHRREAFQRALCEPVSVLFLLLLGAMALSFIPSADRTTTGINVLHWVGYYVAFISARLVVDSRPRFEFLTAVAMVSAGLLALWGIVELFFTNNFGYLRLASTFNDHNAFAGFLLLPLVLLYARTATAKTRVSAIGWGVCGTLVSAAFVLTFSRGSWLSLLIALVLGAALFFRPVVALARTRVVAVRILALLACSALLVAGLLALTQQRAATQGQEVGVFTGETLEANALTARLHYFDDALTIIRHNPLMGVGLRTYGEAVKRYKDTPAYYASSPHNEFLKLFAEIGLLGGLLFTLLVFVIVWSLYRSARQDDSSGEEVARSAVFIGAVATILALCMEVNWGYAANPLLFFLIVGAVYGQRGIVTPERVHRWGRGLAILVLGSAAAISCFSISYWYDSYHLEMGLAYLSNQKYDAALAEFRTATRLGDFDFSPHFHAATTLERLSHLTNDPTKRRALLEEALDEIHRSIEKKPKKPLFYSWEALIYRELGDEEQYEAALLKTITFNPVEGIYEYEQLMQLYVQQKAYEKAIAIAKRILPSYPPELYANPYWVNPYKKVVWEQVANVYLQASTAYARLGDTAQASDMAALAKQYFATASQK
ncbi:MAG: O-antigen ligase family protein [Patescibacteria group bacterium]